jgi:hypothetical protein
MNENYIPKIKCSEIKKEFQTIPLNELWDNHLSWIRTLKFFWEGAITKYSIITGLPNEKLGQHIKVINQSFEMMDDWKNERIKYVQARRKDIDSAISFIRNTALDERVSNLLISPICRNVASVLRLSLYISTNGYNTEQLPLLYAKSIYDLASIRSYFPIDTSNLTTFLPFGKGLDGSSENYSEDNWHLMMEIAADKIGIGKYVINLNNEAALILDNYKNPLSLIIPNNIWEVATDGISKDLYNYSLSSFHGK